MKKVINSFKDLTKWIFIGKRLPCYVISFKPYIIICYWHDFLLEEKAIMNKLKGKKNAHIIFQLGWERESFERVQEIKNELTRIEKKSAAPNFHFLCNSTKEHNIFKELGLNSEFCHQNAFLDESIYKVSSKRKKNCDAIYVARISAFKRHHLATKIKNLKLIGGYHQFEKDYVDSTMEKLKHAQWIHNLKPRDLVEEICTSRVGLCLSKIEGAMFVSAEYLLCGIPVITTNAKGGRDFFLKHSDQFVQYVSDDPESVRLAVDLYNETNIDPNYIRETTLKRMYEHRDIFINYIQEIYNNSNIAKNFITEWRKVFTNKLGIRCPFPWRQWHRVMVTRY